MQGVPAGYRMVKVWGQAALGDTRPINQRSVKNMHTGELGKSGFRSTKEEKEQASNLHRTSYIVTSEVMCNFRWMKIERGKNKLENTKPQKQSQERRNPINIPLFPAKNLGH